MSSQHRLSDTELAEVVQRAVEIQELQTRLDPIENNLDDYVKAAEEMGVSKAVMEQALKERFAFIDRELEAGELVFAKSADERFYVSRVSHFDEATVAVEFLNGGESRLPRHQLRDLSMTPGTHLEFDSTLNMMFVYGRVLQFDRNALTVTFDYWGMKETVPLSKVRMRREKKSGRFNLEWWMYLVGGMVGGGLLSWLATWLIMR